MKKGVPPFLIVGVLLVTSGILATWGFSASLFHGGVLKFGPLVLGGESPLGPGAATFAPELSIPSSQFYIGVAEKNLKNLWCVLEECSPLGEQVASLGGWLQGDDTNHWTSAEDFGLTERTDVASIIVVGNKEGRLVGIYPNKGMDDLNDLLQVHRTLWE